MKQSKRGGARKGAGKKPNPLYQGLGYKKINMSVPTIICEEFIKLALNLKVELLKKYNKH